MHEKEQKEINDFPCDNKHNSYVNYPDVKNQEIFSISSPKLNYPSKKPCLLTCSHHHHSHLTHPLPHQPKKQNDKLDIDKKIKIVRDISERKSEIWLNEPACVIPSLKHVNGIYLKETNAKNEYTLSTTKLGNNMSQNNCDTKTKEPNKNHYKLNNISKSKLPSDFHFHGNHDEFTSTFHHSKIDLEKSNNLYRNNILFQRDSINNPNQCDMTHLLDKLKIVLNRFLKKKLVLVCVVAILFFLIGVAIQFYNTCEGSSSEAVSSRSDYASLKGMNPYFIKKSSRLNKDSKDTLNSLFISVKTTQKYHRPRVTVQLETWASLVKEQTWYFSDTHDKDINDRTGGRLIVTNCSNTRSRTALACKMAAEFDHFMMSNKRWWCHFDDDNYVHVVQLLNLLKTYSSSESIYLGKPSTAKPLEIFDGNAVFPKKGSSEFWFATGGAGYCISRTLAMKMAPFAANGKFIETGNRFWFPDDVTIGYIIEYILGEKLTIVPEFHSHLESMKSIRRDELHNQITFSYIYPPGGITGNIDDENLVNVPGPFSKDVDPTRFYSLHCLLYRASYCPDDSDLDNG